MKRHRMSQQSHRKSNTERKKADRIDEKRLKRNWTQNAIYFHPSESVFMKKKIQVIGWTKD